MDLEFCGNHGYKRRENSRRLVVYYFIQAIFFCTQQTSIWTALLQIKNKAKYLNVNFNSYHYPVNALVEEMNLF